MNELPLGKIGVSFSSERGAESVAGLASVWLLVISGTLAGIAVAYFVELKFPHSHKGSWGSLLVLATVYVSLASLAGFLEIVVMRHVLTVQPAVSSELLSLYAGMGWVFIPCMTLLYLRDSMWMLAVSVVIAVIVTVRIRSLYSDDPETAEAWAFPPRTDGIPTFAGLPVERQGLWRAPFLSLFMQLSLFPIFAGDYMLASVLLSVCACLLVWRWSASQSWQTRRKAPNRRWLPVPLLAIFLTWLMLIPGVSRKPFAPSLQGREKGASHTAPDTGSDYVGIILLPPPQKKVKVIPPVPQDHPAALSKASQPVVIPFDGAYWYFKAPYKRPGVKAHVAHGRSTLVNIRSSDMFPLLMEAHQSLGSSIDLRCCGEIEVAITNADNRPGRIAIGVLLTDSSAPGKPWESLGERPIASSGDHISLNRPPVDEVLRFPIPRSGAIHRFNEITVVFLPSHERAQGGTKVAIQSFRLIPR